MRASLHRTFTLLAVQMRASLLNALQYRFDLFGHFILSGFWSVAALLPLSVLYRDRTQVLGFSWPQAALVIAFFLMLQGVMNAWIQPSLLQLVDMVRKGTLDFLLVKPADAQFLLSTSKFDFHRATDIVTGLALAIYACRRLPSAPTLGAILTSALLAVQGAAILYSLLLILVCTAFYVVKVDNLAYLLVSIYDTARWPRSVFQNFFRILFTFILPFAVMTSFPAEALFGALSGKDVLLSSGLALGFLAMSRVLFTRSVRRYSSASS